MTSPKLRSTDSRTWGSHFYVQKPLETVTNIQFRKSTLCLEINLPPEKKINIFFIPLTIVLFMFAIDVDIWC